MPVAAFRPQSMPMLVLALCQKMQLLPGMTGNTARLITLTTMSYQCMYHKNGFRTGRCGNRWWLESQVNLGRR